MEGPQLSGSLWIPRGPRGFTKISFLSIFQLKAKLCCSGVTTRWSHQLSIPVPWVSTVPSFEIIALNRQADGS
ncbi:hypothetical protein KP509_31G073000 [Ceratopteris richardii]|uniref:Uncharacterized protein n=1 Tax=Ceratopteris richardii TaxID=49495 RepID=A0A8T2QZ70_CERRI|nr:hypothetical protein KP509_31G073000 [Ceratopteris richardii]